MPVSSNLDTATVSSTREAASISASIAFNSASLFVSLFLRFAIPDSPHIFATATNISFLASAFYVQLRATSSYGDDPGQSEFIKDSYLVSNLSTCACIFLTLLGASSFGFHSESILFNALHSFDILFGWLLILNLAFTSLSTSFYAWAGRRLTRQLHSTTFVLFLLVNAVLIISYDAVYTNQVTVIISLAVASIVFAVVSRLILLGKRPNTTTIVYAIAEILVLCFIAVSAVFCQGELLGSTLSRESNGKSYDLFHGFWHFFLSSVASIVDTRCLSAARMIENDYPVCVCQPSLFDILGEASLFVLAITALVLKEIDVDASVSLVTLAIVSCPLYVHAVATGFM